MSGISNAGLGYIDSFPVFFEFAIPLVASEIFSDSKGILFSGKYHLFTKAESLGQKHIEHAVADLLIGPYTFVQTGDFAGWGEIEGPCLTTLPDGTFRL